MRYDETDEEDRSGDGGGRAAQHHRTERRATPDEGHPLAESGGQVVAQCQRVQGACGGQADDETGAEERQDAAELLVGGAADAADLPEPEGVGDVVARQDDGAHQGGQRGRDGGTGEGQFQGVAPPRPSEPMAYTKAAVSAAPSIATQMYPSADASPK